MLTLVVLIQVSAVPGWNQQVEFEHNQRLQGDMQEFVGAVSDTLQTGESTTTVVELGTRYPPRPFLFNPPPAAGTLETGPQQSVTVENANLVGVDNVWRDGQSPAYPTRAVIYRPEYNEYRNAPVTAYEGGLLYNEYENAVLRGSDPGVVDGREVDLVTVTGELRESGTTPFPVRVDSLAGTAQTVPVQSDDGSFVVVEVPTRLDADTWRDLLADELDGGAPETDNSPDAYIADLEVRQGDPMNTLVLRLEPGPANDRHTYQLRTAKLGVGDGTETERAHYVTDVEADAEDVDDGAREVTVEVRNKYNNPVPGVTVEFDKATGTGSFVRADGTTTTQPVTVTTGEDGRATLRYRAVTNSTITVGGDLDGSGSPDLPREQTTVEVASSVGSGGGIEDGGINPDSPRSVVLVGSEVNSVGCGGGGGAGGGTQCNVEIRLQNRNQNDARTISEARINFFFISSSGQVDKPNAAQMFSEVVKVRGPFVQFAAATQSQRTIAAGQTEPISIRFYSNDAASNPVGVGGSSKFFALTVIYENGQSGVYLIDTSNE